MYIRINNINTYIYICIYIYSYIYTKYIYVHTYIHIYIYIYVYYKYLYMYINVCVYIYPRTEEIVLKIITTAKISNKFSPQSPYISNTLSRESSKFQANFHVSQRSPRHSKELPGFPAESRDPNILSMIFSVSGYIYIYIYMFMCIIHIQHMCT